MCQIGIFIKMSWQIMNKSIIQKTDWMEEEDFLLDWAENANFEKYPLSKIAITFIYVNIDQSIVGVAKTSIELEKRERSAVLHRSDFFDKVRSANNPISILENSREDNANNWLNKKYIFEDAAIYHVQNDHENIDNINKTQSWNSIHFHKDVEKIPISLLVFQDLSEIFVIMREVKKAGGLKSTMNDSRIGKTKKVRISDDSPKEFVFSKLNPVSGRRRTHKLHN